jgi:hypothetical protein
MADEKPVRNDARQLNTIGRCVCLVENLDKLTVGRNK